MCDGRLLFEPDAVTVAICRHSIGAEIAVNHVENWGIYTQPNLILRFARNANDNSKSIPAGWVLGL